MVKDFKKMSRWRERSEISALSTRDIDKVNFQTVPTDGRRHLADIIIYEQRASITLNAKRRSYFSLPERIIQAVS